MANPRVHEIASDLGVSPKVVLSQLKTLGLFVKGPSSSVAPPVARRVKAAIQAWDPGRFSTRFARAYPRLLAALPTSLPQLCDQLVIELKARAAQDRADALAAAVRARSSYYCDADTGRRAVAGVGALTVRALDESLPSQIGVLAIRGAAQGLTLLAWATATPNVTGIVLDGSPYPRLAHAHDGASQSDPLVGLLLSAVGLIPLVTRSSTGSRLHPEETTRPLRPGNHAAPVRIVYAVRGAGTTDRGAVTQPRSTNWLVRGHWRNQWYPSLADHQRIWIAEHQAGTADGAALSHDLVHVIRPRD